MISKRRANVKFGVYQPKRFTFIVTSEFSVSISVYRRQFNLRSRRIFDAGNAVQPPPLHHRRSFRLLWVRVCDAKAHAPKNAPRSKGSRGRRPRPKGAQAAAQSCRAFVSRIVSKKRRTHPSASLTYNMIVVLSYRLRI